ncbi:hypothetical protein [Acidithiobacillus sulfurivorans]|uniref:MBL fold metallo-hydrolase n=1 Tax=Acidithiobacillus sulfurivorans TaxID=1958756 RepID=A0ABS5ZW98_9PROT|nr:hypothetical protein [Acidithiobacillus sulfurivorans]MBU2759488.1 hypothetical protein [Acidithiobacillus sulfurivorans]
MKNLGAVNSQGFGTVSPSFYECGESIFQSINESGKWLWRMPCQNANVFGYNDIIFHPKEEFTGSNDNSTVKLFRGGMFNVASLGDIEHPNIGSMLRRSSTFTTEVDILILAHHGSDNDINSKKFFKAVRPTIAVCSADYDNQYGHPHDKVRKVLHELDIRVATTKTGDILVESIPNHRKEYLVTNYKSNTTDVSSQKCYVSKKFHLLNMNADTIRNRLHN